MPVTQPGAGVVPRTLSITNASGHGSARATSATRTVITTEGIAYLRYGRR
jgi:hypothetical protein